MKQYFVKYLQVEGEIKEGDFYSCPHKGHAIDVGNGLPHSPKFVVCEYQAGIGLCKDCYKIELFLCSRDIQLGDKNINSWTKKNGYLISQNDGLEYIEIYPSGRAHLKNNTSSGSYELPLGYSVDELHGFESDTYKVIGKISPEATWVKEGDEFEENEWRICILGDGVNWTPVNKASDWSHTQTRIEFKCSQCKTYH